MSIGEKQSTAPPAQRLVRSLQTVGDLAPSTPVWTKTTSVSVAREWKPENLKVIGFLQEQQGWRIIGAGWSEVEGPTVK
jgi:hypothetical protein